MGSGEEEKMAVGGQQQKEGAARRQQGTRGTHASFGGAVANLVLVTPAKYRGVTSNSKEKLKHCRSSDQALR